MYVFKFVQYTIFDINILACDHKIKNDNEDTT